MGSCIHLPHSWTQPKGCLCCSRRQTQNPAAGLFSKVSNLYRFAWFYHLALCLSTAWQSRTPSQEQGFPGPPQHTHTKLLCWKSSPPQHRDQAVTHPVPHRTIRTTLPSTQAISFQAVSSALSRKDLKAVKEPSDLHHPTALTSNAQGAVRWLGFGAILVH